MKRDWSLIRKLLLNIEEGQVDIIKSELPRMHTIPGIKLSNIGKESDARITPESVKYHLILLIDEGFLRGKINDDDDTDDVTIKGLSWKGHNFCERLRSDKLWNRIVKLSTEKGVEITSDLVSKMIESHVSEVLKLFLGNNNDE